MNSNDNKVLRLLPLVSCGLYEKEHVVALSLLAAVAGESIFLIGPPGTAKSMIARRMKYIFAGGKSFEYLMSRFSTPDEIFGPVSIEALKDHGQYKRLTEGYLPDVHVVFLDEIWKAGPAIQNSLLTVLNERIYLNGNTVERIPLKLLMAASNELPSESENLEALWDRFLVRTVVEGIIDKSLFERMITSYDTSDDIIVPENLLITDDDLALWYDGIRQISVPSEIFTFVHTFRAAVQSYNASVYNKGASVIYISDRRWKKILHLWRTSAFLRGCSAVGLADVTLLSDMVWSKPSQIPDINNMIRDVLFEVMSDTFGLELVKARMDAVRATLGVKAEVKVHKEYKVVKSFFYQIDGVRSTQQILIYINEYKALKPDQPTPCVMMYDKLKTGAQIIRIYEKSRFPSVFPKDLLQVRVPSDGRIEINGCEYSLAETAVSGQSEQRKAVVTEESRRIVSGISDEVKLLYSRVDEYYVNMQASLREHPFLSAGQYDIFMRASGHLRDNVKALVYEAEEIVHAIGG